MRSHDFSGVLFPRFLVALLSVVPHSTASAADPPSASGAIRGVIRLDAHHVADYADVRVPELRRGVTADAEGRYRFDAVPPGDYEVAANVFGRTEVRGRVRVVAGGVATLNLQLGEERVVGEVSGTEVFGDAPKVRPDQIGARYRVDEKKIREYRPNSLADVVGQQAGVVNTNGELHLRGGRVEELKVLVGGIEAFDVLGSRNAQVALGAVASAELVSGGVNPENGNALSGVLSVTTREGGPKFGGDLRWDTDRYGDPTKTFERYDRISIDAGGPTAVRALTWFATYEGTFQDGALASGITHPQRTLFDFIQLGNRQDNRINTQWKLAWTPSTTHHLTLEGLANRTLTTPYVHSWSRRGFVQVTYDTTGAGSGQPQVPRYGTWSPTAEDSSFVPMNMADHVPTLDDRYHQVTLAWRYTPERAVVATTRLALVDFHTTNTVGGSEPWDYQTQSPFYWSGNTVAGSENNPYFATHGDYPLYSDSRSRAWTLKGDVTSARWPGHRAKVGVEGQLHEVRNLALTFPNGESNGLPGAVRSDYLNRYPQGGAFAHDLWQHEGLVLSTGLRFDVFSPGQQVALSELPSGKRFKHQWSPRLGVSYPVSDRDALSFHYGWTYQTVTSSALFENRGVTSTVGTQGNPDLAPETDVAYQAALQHEFARDLFGQFTLFYRDIYGLLTVRPELDPAGNQVSVWTNGDYASSRGFELSLVRSFSHHFSSDVAYTYSIATGVASDPAQAQQFVNGGRLYLPISERALRWDQRHSLSWQATVRYPGLWGMHAQWSYSSGLPFTPLYRNDRRPDPKLENSRRLPTVSRLELSGDRYLKLWAQDLTLFVDARNVLDARNIAGLSWGDGFNPNVNLSGGDDYAIYFTETGRAGGAYLQDTNGDHVLDWVPLHDPRVFEEGRNVRLGLAMSF